jgi:hypothetical protein
MASEANFLEADYLVVGAGAMGMAFTDVIVDESNASVIIVDKHDKPGGHWNDAYPFVRLHSASAYYGVNSTPLGEDKIVQTGLNRGFHEQATAAEICAYFDRVLHQQFLPSGRVRFFPRCEYRGDGNFVSLVSGRERRIHAKKIVDATFTDTVVPSRCAPKYSVAPSMRCVPPNALPTEPAAARYVVVGAGKTAMDVCLWLLEHDIAPEQIRWIMPRDSWLLDRAHFEPREPFWMQRMSAFVKQMELIQTATTAEGLFRALGQQRQLLRIDEQVLPTRYRCATVSQAELAELRRIRNIVRLGHVLSIESDRVLLDEGEIETNSTTLHIDCTANGIRSRDPMPVFTDRRITLQAVRTCQQCFSAALTAHVDLTFQDDEQKNALCKPIPLPMRERDWLTMFAANLANQFLWATTPEIRNWIARSRLDLNYRATPLSSDEGALLQQFKEHAARAPAKLQTLLLTV